MIKRKNWKDRELSSEKVREWHRGLSEELRTRFPLTDTLAVMGLLLNQTTWTLEDLYHQLITRTENLTLNSPRKLSLLVSLLRKHHIVQAKKRRHEKQVRLIYWLSNPNSWDSKFLDKETESKSEVTPRTKTKLEKILENIENYPTRDPIYEQIEQDTFVQLLNKKIDMLYCELEILQSTKSSYIGLRMQESKR